ncbi:MAG: lytic transglycosylase domain-containing protein [Verrucomicrobiota bacterium]
MKFRFRISLILASLLAGLIGYFFWSNRREHRQDGVIVSAAKRYRVDPALVKAVVWRETRFDASARGQAGEMGLMQIMESAALDWASAEKVFPFEHEQLFDPETNTLAGAWYLKKLLRRYTQTDDPVPYALADYNAGRGNVLKWNKGEAATNSQAFLRQIGFPGTSNYVRAVMDRYEHYRFEFSAPANRP